MFFVSVPPVFIHRTNKRGTLLIAPKHAEGMSLRYGVVFLVGGGVRGLRGGGGSGCGGVRSWWGWGWI